MSYKSDLQSNNVDLQGILDKVNALPEMEDAPELPTLSNPAAAAQILSGYEVLDQHGIKLTGIMEDNGAVSQALNAGGSYTIPAGYHNGSGKVTGNSLASQTSATAAAGDIRSGKTAWVNGAKVSGNLVPTQLVTGKVADNNMRSLYIPNIQNYNNFVITIEEENDYNPDNQISGGDCWVTIIKLNGTITSGIVWRNGYLFPNTSPNLNLVVNDGQLNMADGNETYYFMECNYRYVMWN